MTTTTLSGLATDTWVALGVSLAYLLLVGPVLAACLYVVWKAGPDAGERAAEDVARFIELREHAHAELTATGSLNRFIELKDEARARLWPSPSERRRAEQVRLAHEPRGDSRREPESRAA